MIEILVFLVSAVFSFFLVRGEEHAWLLWIVYTLCMSVCGIVVVFYGLYGVR